MSEAEPEAIAAPRLVDIDLDVAEPMALFEARYRKVLSSEEPEPTAMTLATVDADGLPNARTVLLKGVDDGFLFFTNYESRKGSELTARPAAALVWFWKAIGCQIRARGRVERIAAEESDRYFGSRRRSSQLGAWASHQSRPIAERAELLQRYTEFEARYAGGDVPRPPHWGGFRLRPVEIELWEEGEFRLHDRVRFTLHDGIWRAERLAP